MDKHSGERTPRRSGEPRHHQSPGSAYEQGVAPLEPGSVNDDPLKSGGQACQRHFQFQPCQRGAKAEMDAEAEAERAPVGAFHVEPTGRGELLRITIGGATHDVNEVVYDNTTAPHLTRARSESRDDVCRAVETQ